MIKLLALLKRRPGLSLEAFRSHYENTHAPLALTYMPEATRYVRRYLVPSQFPASVADQDEYDVVTEIDFRDAAAFETAMNRASTPEAAPLANDEDMLFDRSRMRIFTILMESESTMPQFQDQIEARST
jgi:uncharacterized protein (TIGR02118 family)